MDGVFFRGFDKERRWIVVISHVRDSGSGGDIEPGFDRLNPVSEYVRLTHCPVNTINR